MPDVRLRGQVEDDVGVDVERLADVVLLQPGALVQELAAAGREIVDDGDVVAARDERIDEVRADEPGSSGNDGPHAPYPRQPCS